MSTTYVQKGERRSIAEDGGWRVTRSYEGPQTQFVAFLDAITPKGWVALEADLANPAGSDGLARVAITWAANYAWEPQETGALSDGLIRRQWLLVGADEQLAIEAHPNIVALDDAYPGWTQLVRQYVSAYRDLRRQRIEEWGFGSGTPDLPDWSLPTPPGVTDSTLISTANTYAKMLLLDESPTWPVSRWTLKKSEQVTAWSTLKVSHANVNRWHTTSRLLADEPGLAAAQLIDIASLTSYIWMKKSPETTATWGQGYELTQEWVSGVLPPAGTVAREIFDLVHGEVIV